MLVVVEPRSAPRAERLGRRSTSRRSAHGRTARPFQVHDLLTGARYLWQGARNYVRLDPQRAPAHVFSRCADASATERDFDYFLVRRACRGRSAPTATHRRRSALVQGRGHLPAARARRSSTPTTTASATSRPHREARLRPATSASTRSGCCRSTRRRCATTATTSPTTSDVHPAYGTREDFKRFVRRGARARPARDHRAGRSTTPPTSIRGSRPRARAPPGSREAQLLRLERRPEQVRRHAHHLHRHRDSNWAWDPVAQAVLLAPLLQPPAGPELRQPAGAARR